MPTVYEGTVWRQLSMLLPFYVPFYLPFSWPFYVPLLDTSAYE